MGNSSEKKIRALSDAVDDLVARMIKVERRLDKLEKKVEKME